jgi:Flp pilus assembly protein TadG
MTRRNSRRARRGSYVLEFVLTFPLWFALVTAMIDYGWLIFQRSTLDAGVGMACRAGAILDIGETSQNHAVVEAAATAKLIEYLAPMTPDGCADCTVTVGVRGTAPARTLECTATLPFTPLLGVYVQVTELSAVDTTWLEWQRQNAADLEHT